MKRSTAFLLCVAVPLTLLLGFAMGRDRLAIRPRIVDTAQGLAFKVSWSGMSHETGDPFWGRVVWQPGWLTPRVLEIASQADCTEGPTEDWTEQDGRRE